VEAAICIAAKLVGMGSSLSNNGRRITHLAFFMG